MYVEMMISSAPVLAQRVLDREVGVGVHHLAARLDAHLVQTLERQLEP